MYVKRSPNHEDKTQLVLFALKISTNVEDMLKYAYVIFLVDLYNPGCNDIIFTVPLEFGYDKGECTIEFQHYDSDEIVKHSFMPHLLNDATKNPALPVIQSPSQLPSQPSSQLPSPSSQPPSGGKMIVNGTTNPTLPVTHSSSVAIIKTRNRLQS